MTLLESRLMVLMTIPPQPRSYDLAITLALVPGGPEPRRNGFSNSTPLTVTCSDGAMVLHLRKEIRQYHCSYPTWQAVRACVWEVACGLKRALESAFEPIVPPRQVCQRCRRPASVCFCGCLVQVSTRTRVVFLQHPRERR